ncbi:phosphotransferase family protein [Paenibacillus xylaniclasticus]|uniref:phosphotransferase family protein n=1 Tax=Paenibacillus xylaniclasticus TaxID=588083 RepID=UPI000FDC72A0|nr:MULTISPECIES: aminoglycoside phosphotransferase family protein [Paenibacillus]GFN30046.1 aminoglycoside phosphotransferase [Paenibacillus curdlanolyticus]
MSKGALIGKGMTADVYEWGEGRRVVKLYNDWFQTDWIHQEASINQAIQEAGVHAPAALEYVEVEGRRGLVYEKIIGVSLLKLIEASPQRIEEYAGAMARLHSSIHQCRTTQLPRQKERLKNFICQSQSVLGERTERICRYLLSLPGGDSICHGDFHPDNILMTEDRSYAIDWVDANIGDPMGDVTRTSLMIQTPYNPTDIPAEMLRQLKEKLNRTYLEEYFRLTGTSEEQLECWILPVAAARLRENIPGERQWLLHMIDSRLKQLELA